MAAFNCVAAVIWLVRVYFHTQCAFRGNLLPRFASGETGLILRRRGARSALHIAPAHYTITRVDSRAMLTVHTIHIYIRTHSRSPDTMQKRQPLSRFIIYPHVFSRETINYSLLISIYASSDIAILKAILYVDKRF